MYLTFRTIPQLPLRKNGPACMPSLLTYRPPSSITPEEAGCRLASSLRPPTTSTASAWPFFVVLTGRRCHLWPKGWSSITVCRRHRPQRERNGGKENDDDDDGGGRGKNAEG